MTQEERRRSARKHLAALHSLGHYSELMEAEFARLARQISNSSLGSHKNEPKQVTAGAADAGRPTSPAPPRRFTDSPEPQHSAIAEEDGEEEADGYFAPASEHRAGLALSRTDRIEPTSDEEEGDTVDQVPPPQAAEASASGAPPPGRSAPVRQGSAAMQAVRGLFRPRANTTGHGATDATRTPAAQPADSHASAAAGAGLEPDQNGNSSIRFATMNRPDRDGPTTGTGRPLPVVGSPLNVRRVPSKRVEDHQQQ